MAQAPPLTGPGRESPDPTAPAVLIFFVQAEDGIRDLYVTGVQTCALPIFRTGDEVRVGRSRLVMRAAAASSSRPKDRKSVVYGKSVDLGGRRIIKKKK